jgi:hypothetical protein
MTDRSTDNPEDQPVPVQPDDAPPAEPPAPIDDVSAEQEAIAEVAAASGVNVPAEPPEPIELAEAEETYDGDDVVDEAATGGDDAGGDAGDDEDGGEAAADLDADELEAAATAAEADERAGTRVDEDVEQVERRAAPTGAAARGAAKAPTSVRAGGRTALEVDPALRIRDRASQVFVALTVIVFVAIFANAMLFGVGGALNARPSASPSSSPASSGSPVPSGSAAPASTAPATTAPTTTAAPSAS